MAIARDTVADLGRSASVTQFTIAYTCTGSNRLLLVHVTAEGGDHVTSVTYAGQAMTQVRKANWVGAVFSYLFILIAPASGANNVVVNGSADNYDVIAYSLSGAAQSSQPDASAAQTAVIDRVATSVTVVAANSWVVHFVEDGSSSSGYTYTNLTERLAGSTGVIADSNGALSAGVFTGTVINAGNNQNWNAFAISIAPFVAAAGGSVPQGNNEKMQTDFINVQFIATASTDLTTNLIRRLKALTGEMTARFKAIIVTAGSKN